MTPPLPPATGETAFSHQTESVLVLLLIQLIVILVAARGIGGLFRRMGHAQAMGEIFAGVVLGPSLLGWVFPGAFQALFPADMPKILPYFSHIGLVFALFLIGMEFDFGDVPRYLRQVGGIALGTLLVPIGAAFLITPALVAAVPGAQGGLGFSLFLGMALAITAIPIMGRVLIETGLTTTRVGVLGITTGASKDLFTWFLLLVAVGIARPPLDLLSVGRTIVLALLLGGFVLTAGRQALVAALRWVGGADLEAGRPNGNVMALALIWAFGLAAATSALGIFAIFGAFLAGVSLSFDRKLAHAISDRMHDLTIYLFLPIFFTSTGLKTDLTSMGASAWMWVPIVTLVGTLSCGGVAALIARALGLSGAESLALGALVNTPGLMVLILLNVGADVGVLPREMFALLMVNAMLRNLMVTPALRRLKLRGLPEMSAVV